MLLYTYYNNKQKYKRFGRPQCTITQIIRIIHSLQTVPSGLISVQRIYKLVNVLKFFVTHCTEKVKWSPC